MKYKYILVIFLILLFLLAFTSLNAKENDDLINQTQNIVDDTINKLEDMFNNNSDNINEEIENADVTSVNSYDQLYDEVIKYIKSNSTKALKIELEDGDYNITKTIGYSTPDSDKKLIIDGKGHTINGNGKDQFMLMNNCSLTVKDTVIENTKDSQKEGAGAFVMISPSTLRVENCTFTGNTGTTKGSIITNRGNTIIRNCNIINNTVEDVGGAIWSTGEYGGSLTVDHNTFRENSANIKDNHERTGIVYIVSGGTNKVNDNVFENNNGRCIHCYNNTSTDIYSNDFKNNTLEFDDIIRGGVIDNYESDIKIHDNTFDDDYTHGQLRGGILYHEIGKLEFYNNHVNSKHLLEGASSTSTCSKGGIIFNRNATADIHDNTFTNIMTGNYSRGGVLFNNLGNVTLENNNFENIVEGKNIEGLSVYNDANGIISVGENRFNSTCNGNYLGEDREVYIYNSIHPSNEGNGTHGITNYN